MKIIPTLNNPALLINVSCTFWGHSFLRSRSRMNPPLQMLRVTLYSLFILVCGLLLPARAWEVNTHEDLTREAIRIIEMDLNTYLEDNLGLEGGLDASIEGGTPREVMIQGSNTEDNGIRFVNHFHYPISNVGLTGPGESAIKWSLRSKETQWFGEFWSWNDAREYYFKALTLPTKDERDEYWGKTFRALGQIMHLLQDSANPSHVRDDPHPFDDGLHDYMAGQSVTAALGNSPFFPDPSMLEEAGPAGPNNEPFANLFDRERYQGGDPVVTLGTGIGVTEYTNANFFSDDTIPGQGRLLSTPIPNPTVAELVPAPVPSPYLTLPRLGSIASPGARAAKLTGNQAAAKFLLTNTNLDLLGQLQLDDMVYEGQSINLIPRAVGYSAAVLTYFFRLQFPLEPTDHLFIVSGTITASGCGLPVDPIDPDSDLLGNVTIPSNLNLSDATVSLYYEQSDGTRVLGGQSDFPRSFPPFDELSVSASILNPVGNIPDPVRWFTVFKGNTGPGVQEKQAILANTDEEAWVITCDG